MQKITVISATNRENSVSLVLARIIASKILVGQRVELISLIDLPSDILSPTAYENTPESFSPIQKLISETQVFIICVPEYNGSYPGIFKLFFDVLNYRQSFND
jgi:NAD(P)H-dependent FMN reductase